MLVKTGTKKPTLPRRFFRANYISKNERTPLHVAG